MLRCEGCGVMHHPGCWVTNGGCATENEHRSTPAAMAYTNNERLSGSPAPHPGEGTRTQPIPPLEPLPGGPEPIPLRPNQRPGEGLADGDDTVVIGATGPRPMIHRTLPSTVGVPAAPRRYQPPPGEQMPRRQMPQIYDGHPLLAYWYVPAAILVAIAVALGVIWSVGKLTGGDGDNKAQNPTPAPTSAGVPTEGASTPAPSPAASPSVSPSAAPSTGAGKFSGGDVVVVTGTGDCLNVRVKAGRENDAIVCVKDGTELRITGGPESASELTWWKVQTELGEGWAAEDYLVKKP